MILHLVLRALLAVGALAGCYFSALLGTADFLAGTNKPQALKRAVALVPVNAAYLARLAQWYPGQREATLRRVIELDPYDWGAWTQLGIDAEVRHHDFEAGERYYLKAAAANHMYDPRWVLTNFYYRRVRNDHFYHWANAALAITPYKCEPIFFQLWSTSHDAALNASIIPDRAKVLYEYASFLVKNDELDSAEPIVDRALKIGSGDLTVASQIEERRIFVGQVADLYLLGGELDQAERVWQRLHGVQWTVLPAPTSEHPLSNGDFRHAIYGHGFDWAPALEEKGINFDQYPDTNQVRFSFSGTQAERCRLMSQYLPLEPGASYRLSWEGRANEIPTGSGIHWQIHGLRHRTAKEKLEERTNMGADDEVSGDLGGDIEGSKSWEFEAPDDARVASLSLVYARPLGQTRIDGTLAISQVSLKRLTHAVSTLSK